LKCLQPHDGDGFLHQPRSSVVAVAPFQVVENFDASSAVTLNTHILFVSPISTHVSRTPEGPGIQTKKRLLAVVAWNRTIAFGFHLMAHITRLLSARSTAMRGAPPRVNGCIFAV
jgi:hypothetical protein